MPKCKVGTDDFKFPEILHEASLNILETTGVRLERGDQVCADYKGRGGTGSQRV